MSMPSNYSEINADRFALASFTDESVLLDLHLCACFRINRIAQRICQSLLEGQSTEAVARDLVRAYSLSVTDAQRDVAAVVTQILSERDTRRVNPISFAVQERRFQMEWNGDA